MEESRKFSINKNEEISLNGKFSCIFSLEVHVYHYSGRAARVFAIDQVVVSRTVLALALETSSLRVVSNPFLPLKPQMVLMQRRSIT